MRAFRILARPLLAAALLLAAGALPAAAQALQVDPAPLDFGPVEVGMSQGLGITLTNTSNVDPIQITEVSIVPCPSCPPAYDTDLTPPIPLPPGATFDGEVTFMPPQPGDVIYDHILRLEFEQASNPFQFELPLFGGGVPAGAPAIEATPSPLIFDDQEAGQQQQLNLLITNTGTADLDLDGAVVLDDPAGAFSVEDANFTLAPGQAQPVEVTFQPPGGGFFAGTVRLFSNDPQTPAFDVPVEGNGLAPPAQVDFGAVRLGRTASQDLVLNNPGPGAVDATFQVENDATGSFRVLPATATLPPGGQQVLTLTFAPQARGPLSARLVATGGVQPSEAALTGTGIAPRLSITPEALDFGVVPPGSRTVREVILENTGTAPLILSGAEVGGGGGAFRVSDGGPLRTIDPGETHPVEITFAPATADDFSAVLLLETNDPDQPEAQVPLQGSSVCRIQADPAALDFGDVRLGTSAEQGVQVTHDCGDGVTLNASVEGDPVFSVAPAGPFPLPSGQPFALTLTYTPTRRGDQAEEALLRIVRTDASGASAEVLVAGRGVAPQLTPSSEALAFGVTTVGRQKTLPLTLTNTGNARLTVSSITVDDDAFALLEGEAFTLPPGGARTLTVGYQPGGPGTADAQLVLISDDPETPERGIRLTAEAVEILLLPLAAVPPGEDAEIAFQVPSDFQGAGGQLFFQRGGEAGFSEAALVADGAVLRGTVPAAFVTARGVRFFAVFTLGTETLRVPAQGDACPAQLRVQIDQLPPPFSLAPGAYRMVSFPAELDARSVGAQLIDDFGAYDPRLWRAFRIDPATSAYVEFPAFDALPFAAAAFWLITRDGPAFAIDEGVSVDVCAAREITVPPGFSQIGSPFPFAVDWDAVEGNGQVQGPIAFDGSGYVPDVDRLDPFSGVFVSNPSAAPVTLRIPPREASTAKHAAAPFDEASYRLRLDATLDGAPLRDGHNYVGFAAEAGFRMNIPEPPAPGPHLRLSLLRDGRRHLSLFGPPTAAGAAWDLDVEAVRPGEAPASGTVTVRLDELDARPAGFVLQVLDLDAGRPLPLDGSAFTVALSPAQPVRRLRLVIGTEGFAGEAATAVVPTTFALGPNFPNPFNPETVIGFDLAAPSAVRLEVFDLLGRRVATLAAGDRPAGHHTVRWDGRDEAGRPAASGVYVYRLRAGSFTATRTMLLLR